MILVKSPRTGERVKASVTRFLTRELKLAVYEQKSRVVKTMTVSSWDFPSEERNCDGCGSFKTTRGRSGGLSKVLACHP